MLDENKLKVTIPKITPPKANVPSASASKTALANLFTRSVTGSFTNIQGGASTTVTRPGGTSTTPMVPGQNGYTTASPAWGFSPQSLNFIGTNKAPTTLGVAGAGAGNKLPPTPFNAPSPTSSYNHGWTVQQTNAYNASVMRQGQNRTINTPNGPYIIAGGADNMRGQAGSDYRSMFEWGASRGYTPGQITNVELQHLTPRGGNRPQIEFNAQTTQAIQNAGYGPGYDEDGNMVGMVKPGFLGMNMPVGDGSGSGGGGYGGWGSGGDFGSKSPWNWGSVLWRI